MVNTDDRDVIRYLKYFTLSELVCREEIELLEKKHKNNPEERSAHKMLATALTILIHGEQAAQRCQVVSGILFGGSVGNISEEDFDWLIDEVPTKEIEKAKLVGAGIPLAEILVHSGLCPSKGQARKDIESGGIYFNNMRLTNAQHHVMTGDFLYGGKHILLRKGKKNYVVVTVK